jgi:hypothetical protein
MKRYVERQTGIPKENQTLMYNGAELHNIMLIGDCQQLRQESVITLLDNRETP